MNTDERKSDGPEAELTFRLIGAAMDVLNAVGHGLHEKPYENALVVEAKLRNLRTDQQEQYPILYKGIQVGVYIPDLIIERRVIVDAKVIDRITDHERGQMLNYLRVTRLQVGLILNFKRARLEWERVVLSS